jgi:RAB protein geranylgeranyltransferase component A
LTKILSDTPDTSIALDDSLLLDYLKKEKFTERLMVFLLCGVLFEKDVLDSTISLKEAFHRIKNILNSLNIYGSSAFLYPIYGIGELPQAFSRYKLISQVEYAHRG